MDRREFVHALAAAAASGLCLDPGGAASAEATSDFYTLPRFGNVRLLHFTDCHAQLLPAYFREPSINIGVSKRGGRPPHVVGEAFLKHYAIPPRQTGLPLE